MGYSTWSVNGFGACVSDLATNKEKIKKLISKAPEFEKELENRFNDMDISNPTLEDYLECDDDENAGIAYILKRVIEEVENIKLCSAEDYDRNRYLLLCPSYPWDKHSDEETRLTEKTVKEIMKKYISVISKKKLRYEYQSVENGG